MPLTQATGYASGSDFQLYFKSLREVRWKQRSPLPIGQTPPKWGILPWKWMPLLIEQITERASAWIERPIHTRSLPYGSKPSAIETPPVTSAWICAIPVASPAPDVLFP